MYAPQQQLLFSWSRDVLLLAHSLSHESIATTQSIEHPTLGRFGIDFSLWISQHYYDIFKDIPLDTGNSISKSTLSILRKHTEQVIWDDSLEADRTDMFHGENIFNFGEYIWTVSILNSHTPLKVFDDTLVDTLSKIIFLATAWGIFSDDDTTLLSHYLTTDLEARGFGHHSFDNSKGYDSMQLLTYFFYHKDTMHVDEDLPIEWVLASWRDLSDIQK